MKPRLPARLQPLVPTAAIDRFLHHSNFHRAIGYTGHKAGVSNLNAVLTTPDAKLCAIFAVAASGVSAVFAPNHLVDIIKYTLAATLFTPVFGTVMEHVVTLPHLRIFFDRRFSGHDNPIKWGRLLHFIDKTPDGESDLPTPMVDATSLAWRHRRMANVMMIVTGGFAAIAALNAYKLGYNPKVLLAAPFLTGLTVRFMASAERFERLRDGTYKLIKLPIQPVSGRNPAP